MIRLSWPWSRHGKTAPARRPQSPKTILRVEVLEDRLVPSSTALELSTYDAWRSQRFSLDQVALANVSTGQGGMQIQAQTGTQASGSFGSLINLDDAFANYSYRGQGYSVAVLDTGIDYTHTDLGGGWGKRVIAGWDFANNDADPMDDNGHGTHVAGIIGSSNATYTGVAPNVNLIALKVLGANGSGSFGAVEDALKWVVANQAKYNIVAVNLSLGAGNYTTNPYTFLEDEFASLKNQGVFIAAASGNSFYSVGSQQGLGYPAISPLTVSVGAVWAGDYGSVSWLSGARDITTAADRIASFTQRSAALDILAPGALITSTYLNNGYQSMAGTSMATPVIAGAAVLLHQALDAQGLHDQANQDYILGLMKNTGATVSDGDDENDNVLNTGLSFKRLDIYAALNNVRPAVNHAPTLAAIGNQTMYAGQSLTVTLSATDPDGDPIAYSARAKGADSPAYQLDQQLGLNFAGSYFTNMLGRGEKWLLGSGNQWYVILPNGELRRWSGSMSGTLLSSALVATLDGSFYNDPSLLWNAQPGSSVPVTVSLSGNRLTLQAPAGYTGSFTVEVTASDGRLSDTKSFQVTSSIRVNQAPTLSAISDKTMYAGQSLTIDLSGSDPDGDALSYTAQVKGGSSTAYQLDQQLGLNFAGSYFTNQLGQGEKWMLGSGNQWYLIMPNGELRRWAGSMGASLLASSLVATLDTSFYNDPSLLWNAQPGSSVPVTVSITGNRLTLTAPASFTGSFTVEVTVSDGKLSDTKSFKVTVAPKVNQAPTLAVIPNQTMTAGTPLTVNLSGSDADGDPLTYSATITGGTSLAYQLDQQLGLNYAGSYFTNVMGRQEKWLLGKNYQWYLLMSNGELRKWTGSMAGSLADSALVAKLDASYYADPSKLWNAQAPTSIPATVTVQGNRLVIQCDPSFRGTFTVEVTVSDGTTTTKRTFTVTV